MIRKRKKSGFTLLELLVVVIILGIIMSFAIPALTGFLDRAREGEGFDLIKKGLTACYLFKQDGGLWPTLGQFPTDAGAPVVGTKYWSALTDDGTNVNLVLDAPNINEGNNIVLRVTSATNHGHAAVGDHEVQGTIDVDGDVGIQVDRAETGAQVDAFVNIG